MEARCERSAVDRMKNVGQCVVWQPCNTWYICISDLQRCSIIITNHDKSKHVALFPPPSYTEAGIQILFVEVSEEEVVVWGCQIRWTGRQLISTFLCKSYYIQTFCTISEAAEVHVHRDPCDSSATWGMNLSISLCIYSSGCYCVNRLSLLRNKVCFYSTCSTGSSIKNLKMCLCDIIFKAEWSRSVRTHCDWNLQGRFVLLKIYKCALLTAFSLCKCEQHN